VNQVPVLLLIQAVPVRLRVPAVVPVAVPVLQVPVNQVLVLQALVRLQVRQVQAVPAQVAKLILLVLVLLPVPVVLLQVLSLISSNFTVTSLLQLATVLKSGFQFIRNYGNGDK
jgi:hypothetical protein